MEINITREQLEENCLKQREAVLSQIEELAGRYNIVNILGDDCTDEEINNLIKTIGLMVSELGLNKLDVARILGITEYKLSNLMEKAAIKVEKDKLIFNKGKVINTEEESEKLGIDKDIIEFAYGKFKTSKALATFDDLYQKSIVEGFTQANIADAMGISRQRIKQVFSYYGLDTATKLAKQEFIDTNKDEIIQLYTDGMSIAKLAEKFNTTQALIREITNDTKKETIIEKVTGMEDDIKELYESGMNLKSIAEMLGIRPGTLSLYTKKFGIVETGKRSVCILPEEEIVEQFKNGASTVELGKMYGVSNAKIYVLLKKRGVYPENIGKFKVFDYIALCVLGKSLDEIAAELGMTNEELTSAVEFKSEEINKALKIVGLREHGLSHSSICKETGYAIGTCAAYYNLYKKAMETYAEKFNLNN